MTDHNTNQKRMKHRRLISAFLVLSLALGMCARQNIRVYAQTLGDDEAIERREIEKKTGLALVGGENEISGNESGISENESGISETESDITEAPRLMLNAAPRLMLNSAPVTDPQLPLPTEGNGGFRYSQLSDVAKKLYDRAIGACKAFVAGSSYTEDITEGVNNKITVSYTCEAGETISTNDLLRVREALYYEAYSFYWISTLINIGVNNGKGMLEICIDPDYYTYESRRTADEALSALVDEWYDELNEIKNDPDYGQLADYYTALRLHDLIISRTDYAYDDTGAPQIARFAHSIAGVGTGEGVVCEGYAKMFSYMLNLLEIDNLFITGDSSREAHAWNAVRLNDAKGAEAWFLCDLTWDDPGDKDARGLNNVFYDYFCMPAEMFGRDHRADKTSEWPEFSTASDYVFYKFFKSYSADTLDETKALTLRDSGLGNRYRGSDFVFFVVPDESSVRMMWELLEITQGYYYSSLWGKMIVYESVNVIEPADSVEIFDTDTGEVPASPSAIAVRGTHSFTAVLPETSDDRVSWSLSDPKAATILSNGRTVTVRGRKNADVVLTATTYAGRATDSVRIVIGEGACNADIYVWAGGAKDYKKKQVTPSVRATNWTDSKGKTKTGKLVWLASDTDVDIEFDTAKHTVKTKTTKTRISVDSKGNVTAKKPGAAYVYACDTGTCTYEVFTIGVLTAPGRLLLVLRAGASSTSDAVKTAGINAGDTKTVYITPTSTLGEPDPEAGYTVSLAKDEYAQYLSVSSVQESEAGYAYFRVTAKNFDAAKVKPASVRITVVNTESGKKASMTVKIGNPVQSITAEQVDSNSDAGTAGLATRKNTVTLKLNLMTQLGEGVATTDKLKLYVGRTSVSLKANGKGVEKDKGATVTASIVKNSAEGSTVKILLKAGKDAGAPAVIYGAVTDAVFKNITLYKLADVGGDGSVTVTAAEAADNNLQQGY